MSTHSGRRQEDSLLKSLHRITSRKQKAGITLTFLFLCAALALLSQQLQIPFSYAEQSTATSVLSTNQSPVASFTLSPSNPLVNNPVTLNATGSFDPDGSIASYRWDFGDGSTPANTTITTHIYTIGQTYTVRLNVTDDHAAVASTYKSIVVKNTVYPVATFTWTPAVPFAGETIFFDGSGSSDPDGVVVSYSWSLGDGASRAGIGVLNTYTSPGVYEVSLSVTDDSGLTTTKAQAVWIRPPLALTLSSNATQGNSPLFISFNAQVVGGQPPYTYSWDFGDGQVSNRPSPVHNYTIARVFRVAVTVTDSMGHIASSEVLITVNGRPFELTFLGVSETSLKVGGALTALSVFPLLVFVLMRRRKG